MKKIMDAIEALTNVLATHIEAGNYNDMLPILDERFQLINQLINKKDVLLVEYLFQLIERDKIMMENIRQEQGKIKQTLSNMEKLEDYMT